MAHIAEWRVRETSFTEGTADLVLAGAMYGSLPFQHTEVMAVGDTCDYVVHYGEVFEAGLGTMAADGKLQRGATPYRARHANGDINTTKVSLPPGVKTVIMSVRANKVVRVDRPQSFTQSERNQANANAGIIPAGTRMVFHQTSAPTGWTKDTTAGLNNNAFRIVTGAASSGGTVNFSTLHTTAYSSNDLTLTTSHLPSIGAGSFTVSTSVGGTGKGISSGTGGDGNFQSGTGKTTYRSDQHENITVSFTGGNAGHAHTINMDVKYQDVIIGIKD